MSTTPPLPPAVTLSLSPSAGPATLPAIAESKASDEGELVVEAPHARRRADLRLPVATRRVINYAFVSPLWSPPLLSQAPSESDPHGSQHPARLEEEGHQSDGNQSFSPSSPREGERSGPLPQPSDPSSLWEMESKLQQDETADPPRQQRGRRAVSAWMARLWPEQRQQGQWRGQEHQKVLGEVLVSSSSVKEIVRV